MNLQTYLDRIEYAGSLEPNLETLRAVHRAHLLRIPYENLDIHLGRTLTLHVRDAYQRIVQEHRGGWCFEMNGLLAWALREIGFEVRLLSGSVGRTNLDGPEYSSHLVLLVELEEGPHLADVGFGDGFLEPLPLREGEYVQDGFTFRIDRRATVTGERWMMHNHAQGGAPHFDFSLQPRTMAQFAEQCEWLQTSPESSFVKTTICQKSTLGGFITLRSATLITLTSHQETKRVLETQHEYETVLRDEFGLEIPDVGTLWAKVWARHLEWVAANSTV
jgi:N-hydroxyarylamine O-acetyltransferase